MKEIPIDLVRRALSEDLSTGEDLTTRYLLPPAAVIRAVIRARSPGIVCGTALAAAAFKELDPNVSIRILAGDGKPVRKGQAIMELRGGPSILSAERVALNFLQKLSGIATLTSRFVRKTRGTKAKIFDTRKTTPMLRALEKYAVRCGGGLNHRMGLFDGVLVKDNHLKSLAGHNLEKRIESLAEKIPRGTPVEIEAQSLIEVDLALKCRVGIVLLDNMPFPTLRKAVSKIRKEGSKSRPQIEVSGGVTIDNVLSIARLGVDRISVGRITHSAPAMDMSLDVTQEGGRS